MDFGLVEDLLEYSRIGTQEHPVALVDLNALVPELFRVISSSLAGPTGPGIKFRAQAGLPVFSAASYPLSRVLFHLLSNAVKHHGSPTGQVELSALDKGGSVEICVADDGPGIEARHHQKIFLPCQTLLPRDQAEGSGMGLALVARILDQHGGSIRLESAPGKGSRFFVTWAKGR